MVNGANLGFRKTAFLEVGGFDGNANIASGDDIFLLHKIINKFPQGVAFAKQKGAIIETIAQPSLNLFINQRIRWASKWKFYTNMHTKATAVFIFMVSFGLVAFPFMVKFNVSALFFWANLIVIKAFFDFFFIKQINQFMGDKINLAPFVLLQVVYPFYIVFTALFSFQKTYSWKGRKTK
jgi:hypothetical protein